jgi:hypothetical protein
MYESKPRSGEARSTIEAPYTPADRRVNNDPRERPQNPRRVSPWVIALGSVFILCAVLTACAAATAGILQGILNVNSPARETVSRQFTVGAVPSVEITVDAANVEVKPGAAGQVSAVLTKETHAITQSLAQQDLNAITLDTTQNGDVVTIHVNTPDGPVSLGDAQRRISLNVSLPPTANVSVNGGAGNVEISGIAGRVNTQLGAGNVTMRSMTFSGSSSARASAGNIEIAGALTPETNLDLSASTGNVELTLPGDTSAHVDATTTLGNASVNGFPQATGQLNTKSVISADLNPNPQSVITAHVAVGNLTIRASA